MGTQYVNDEDLMSKPIEMTQKLMDFKKQIDHMITYAFANNIKFEKARDTSFQNFMNKNQQTPQYIAKYTDDTMITGLNGLHGEEIDFKLNCIVRLFCCLNSRDTYVKAYQNHLCNRLLNKLVSNQDAEELMLSKLKMELGINAVNKMT